MDSTSVAALQQASVLQASPNNCLDNHHQSHAVHNSHHAALFNQHAAAAAAVGGYVSNAISQNQASNYLATYAQNSAAFQYQAGSNGGGAAAAVNYGGQSYGGAYSIGNSAAVSSITSAAVNNNIDLSSVYQASYAAAAQQQHANPSAYASQAVAYYSGQYGSHSTVAASNTGNSGSSSAYAATNAMAAAAAANSQHQYYQQQQQQQQIHGNSASPSAVASATAAAAAAAYGMFGFGANTVNGASSSLATAAGFSQQQQHHIDLASHYGALQAAPSPDGGGGCGARDNESSTNEASDNAGDGMSGHHNGSNGGGVGGRVTKKGGKKPRRRPDSPAAEGDMEKIFIWELDDTILLFASLLTGKFAQRFQKEDKASHLKDLGICMEDFIFNVADHSFFHQDLDQCDQVHIDDVTSDEIVQDLSTYNFDADGFQAATLGAAMCLPTGVRGGVDWMRKLAHRYRVIRDRYTLYRSNIQGILDPATQSNWANYRSQLEDATDCWSSMALKCLSIISARPNCENILVTTNNLVIALAKVLIYGFGSVFPIENIYSCTKVGREACFERVVQRYGKKPCYIVVGDGADEESVAKTMNLPYWRVGCHADLAALYCALDNLHL